MRHAVDSNTNHNHDALKLINIVVHVRECSWCAGGPWKSTFKKSVKAMCSSEFLGPFPVCDKYGGYGGYKDSIPVPVVEIVENEGVESGEGGVEGGEEMNVGEGEGGEEMNVGEGGGEIVEVAVGQNVETQEEEDDLEIDDEESRDTGVSQA